MKEKKRIYSGKKYPSEVSRSGESVTIWRFSYKYKGQKSFWARTEESPEEYEKRLVIEEIQEKAKEITIEFRGKDYTDSMIDKLWDEIREERIKYHDNETQDEEFKLTSNVIYELSGKLNEKQDDFIKAQMKLKGIPYNE
jgi:hypothetical protein